MAIVLAWAVAAVALWLLLTAERSSARVGSRKRAEWLRAAALEAEEAAAAERLLPVRATRWQQQNQPLSLSDYN